MPTQAPPEPATAPAAAPPWPVQTADSTMRRRAPSSTQWRYEHGLILKAIEQVWLVTGDARYYRFVEQSMGHLIDSAGRIKSYALEEYNLDLILPGRVLFALYRETGDPRYKKALLLLREQLRTQPRTSEGSFWHKRIYPHQVWLDGIYMALPFYAEFAQHFAEPAGLDDVARQVILAEKHTGDPATGLLYHAWDESRAQRWAHPDTGRSPCFWGRAMGWYAMALVDVLDHLPEGHPQRQEIVAVVRRLASAVAKVQDEATGLWYQVLDQGGREGNYLEASASAMFVYALAKGVRLGYLETAYREAARRGFRGMLANLVRVDEQGSVNLEGTCAVAGLGGDPYRDGSYEYYVSEPIETNNDKGVGPFILASLEMECISRGD